ncbi:hypothetical protein ASG87_08685 [Frateuria sp. Soil773]|uniref:hypothetical protein n=1 Tax=Frateuria sp. Soil773 TaxID=1736407 RepID=UPI0006FDDF76|nr:hypothetical protein [Frateuria sp. Soil773]KRE88646.1 hypothetical protein ASG87_08685 [Frateuria sp. Soil773]
MSGRRDQHEGPRSRTEPTLGDLDHLDAPPPAGPPRDDLPQLTIEPERRRASHGAGASRAAAPRRWPWLLLLAVLGLLLVLWLNQDRLRGLVPSTGLNDTLSRAELALQDGRLDGPDGARELFESARAQEPDNDRARDGLRKVGMAELARADAALNAGKLDEAGRTLDAARELLGGGSDVDRLDAAIARARGAATQADGLIEQAQQALAAGRLDGSDGAGALYRRVLAGDPGNAVAAHGLDKVGAALAAKARAALAANDLAAAGAGIDQLAALLPNYGELPSLRAALAQGRKQDSDALATALKQGQEALRAGRIGGEGDDTALAYFKRAQALDPDNAEARAGLGQVAQALIVQANAALDGDDRAAAARLLDAAAALAPRSADLAAARARLGSDASEGTGSAGGRSDAQAPDAEATVPAMLTPAQSAEVASLVTRAQTAARRGQIMLPPGESAYDLYRSALAIDGNNGPARQGLQNLPNLVSRQLEQALANGNLAQAGELLADLSDLAPGDAGQEQWRQRLAGAWLDQAEQQLARGDRANATQSVEQARKVAPNLPRLQDVAARLQAAR